MTEPTTADPSTDLVAAPDLSRGMIAQGASLSQRIHYAQTLAASGLLPQAYRQNPPNVLVAVETGTMLGIHPIAAINGINVIEGKPTISPALMSALVRRAGHKLRVRTAGTVEGGDLTATAELIRSDDPEAPFTCTWNLARAERAGLCTLVIDEQGRTVVRARSSKGKVLPWESYTEAMLKARAIGEVSREGAEEALCGVHYTAEELGAVVDVDGDVVDGEVVIEQHDPRPAAEPAPAAAAAEEQPTTDDGGWTGTSDELATIVARGVLTTTSTDDVASVYATLAPIVARQAWAHDLAGVNAWLKAATVDVDTITADLREEGHPVADVARWDGFTPTLHALFGQVNRWHEEAPQRAANADVDPWADTDVEVLEGVVEDDKP